MRINPRYVKFGLAGYGPDLEPDDEPYVNVASLCSAIRFGLDASIDMLADQWSIAKANDEPREYMAARELADELGLLMTNLDYERRQRAPLYVTDNTLLDADMLRIIDGTFPLDVSTTGYQRIYVWEAGE